ARAGGGSRAVPLQGVAARSAGRLGGQKKAAGRARRFKYSAAELLPSAPSGSRSDHPATWSRRASPFWGICAQRPILSRVAGVRAPMTPLRIGLLAALVGSLVMAGASFAAPSSARHLTKAATVQTRTIKKLGTVL